VARTASDLLQADHDRTLRAVGTLALEKRSAPLVSSLNSPSEALLQSLGIPTKSGASVTSETAKTISTVYACVQILSGIIARLPKKLVRKTANGHEVITDHPSCRLVNLSPDGIRTPFQWMQAMEAVVLTRGNALALIERNAYFEPVALKWLNPLQTEIWRTPDGDIFYRYRGKVLQHWEVFHHKELSEDGVTGISPVTAMRESMGLALTTQEHAARHFSNGAAPGLVMMAPLAATKEQMDRIRDEVNRNHGGVANSNKPFVAYGGLDVKPISLSNQDSQFLESRKFDVEEIARAYRVPLHLLQSTEKTTSWGSGVEQLNRAFVDFSLADRLTRWEQELDMALLTEEDRLSGLHWSFDTSALTRGTAKERAERYQIMRRIRAMNVNDVREEEGMNDLPDHIGDDYLLGFSDQAQKPGGANGAQQDPALKEGNDSP
jgi:HK97 family phage portal protein